MLDDDIITHDLNILQMEKKKKKNINFVWSQFHNCIYPLMIEKNDDDEFNI